MYWSIDQNVNEEGKTFVNRLYSEKHNTLYTRKNTTTYLRNHTEMYSLRGNFSFSCKSLVTMDRD